VVEAVESVSPLIDRSGPDGDQELSGAGGGRRNDLVKEELKGCRDRVFRFAYNESCTRVL
jgi:hypothetical protein